VKVLVKLGGSLLDDPALRISLAQQLSAAYAEVALVLVHGGGKQMTRFLAERGVESRFVGGLRVTTPEVVDAVLKVFAGSVNKQLVGALRAAGAPAAGLSGIDGGLAVAEQLNPDLGAVGRIVRADARILDTLLGGGFLPVVACVAGGDAGSEAVFNVNADQMAVACAAAWKADRLLFLTDVPGVKGTDGSVIARLTPAAARGLIRSGVATGGMQAKLESACAALAAGVREVRIAPGAEPGILKRLLGDEEAGTALVPEAASS
jgi:acetylglutamate kinase